MVRLRPHRRAIAPAPDGTIRSDRVVVLSAPVKEVFGADSDPTAIVLSSAAAKRIGAGAILSAAPSPVLPGGLMHRVTGIQDRGLEATLAVDPGLAIGSVSGSLSDRLGPCWGVGALRLGNCLGLAPRST